jgi:hypothetical protein
LKGLSHEVDEPTLFERFSKYGDVYQVRVEEDDYSRRSASVSHPVHLGLASVTGHNPGGHA